MKSHTAVRIQVIILSLLVTMANPVRAVSSDASDYFSFSVGGCDINDNETAAEVRIEYRAQPMSLGLRPISGLMLNHDSAVYGYGGLLFDFHFTRRILFSPRFAAGLYYHGSSKDLGAAVEFRSQIEMSYRFEDQTRLAFSLGHMSNAGIDDKNPGAESIVLSYIIPFSNLLHR